MIGELDIMAEWLAIPSLNSRQRGQVEALGVTREAMHRCGGLGWSRVSTTGRVYMPSTAGQVMLIQPGFAGPAPSIYEPVEHPVLDDLLAWHPDTPTRWTYRVGTPPGVLGADNLALAHSEGWGITFELTPLAWLRGDCRGACLLEVCEAHWRDLDEAERRYRGALAIHEKLSNLEGMANSYVNLGRVYADRGDASGARGFWTKSLDLYDRIGMPHMVERIQRGLDALDDASPDASPDPPGD